MKKLLTIACLFVVTAIAIVAFIAPTVFGQEKETAKVKGSELSKSIPAAVEWRFDQASLTGNPRCPFPAQRQ